LAARHRLRPAWRRRADVSGLWTPRKLGSALKLWLRADGETYQDDAGTVPAVNDGDVVGCWKDQSGNGNDAAQATTSKKPLLKLGIRNGKQALLFDGTDDYLWANLMQSLSQPFSVFAVAQLLVAGDDTAKHIIGGSTTDELSLGQHPSSNWFCNAGTTLQDGSADENWDIWSVLFNGVNSELRINGNNVASGDAGTNNPDATAIGRMGPFSTGFWEGYIAEIIICDPSPTNNDRDKVESYLAKKYGITLS